MIKSHAMAPRQRGEDDGRVDDLMMAPVNVLLASSTVPLGYHYLVDVPAGIAVAFAVAWCVERIDVARPYALGEEAHG